MRECKSFFLVGIGGVSMSALATILLKSGKIVAGYDKVYGDAVAYLQQLGVSVIFDLDVDISGYDCVVITDAISPTNRILKSARKLNKLVLTRGQLLAEISSEFSKVIAVGGCHGKTTSTAMLAHIFNEANKGFCVHVGGFDYDFNNAFKNGNEYFITEACEYKRNFLSFKPTVALILSTDADHLDCYGSIENLHDAYQEFANNAYISVGLYGDGVNCAITFGLDDRADYYAKKVKHQGGAFSFIVYERGKELGVVKLGVVGKHNVLNALGVIAAARACGIAFSDIAKGLCAFKGVKRRFEALGKLGNATCIADYAHHPNEIKAVLKTARLVTQGNLYVIFQPHTYSRTKTFFKEFVNVLSGVKRLTIYKTYAAREYYDDAGSALTLSRAIKRSKYADCPDDIIEVAKGCKEGDTLLILGAGDLYDIAKSLISS